MSEERFMGFGFQRDFNIGQASSDCFPPDLAHLGSGGFLEDLDTNPFLKNQCYNESSSGLDLCKKLGKMGIACDMNIWSTPEPLRLDPGDLRSRQSLHAFSEFEHNLSGASGIRNVSPARHIFLQNTSHGVSPGDLRLLGLQDSINPNGFEEMMAHKNHNFLFGHTYQPIMPLPLCHSSGSLGNDELMFEGERVSRALATMEGSKELRASYREENITRVSLGYDASKGKRVCPALAAMEVCGDSLVGESSYGKISSQKSISEMPLNLSSMLSIYRSVDLMARDQTGCRVLRRLLDEGTFHVAKVIFLEIIDHLFDLSIDPFGSFIVQKLLDVCDEETRTLIVSVLTSKPMELIKICLNANGTQVVRRMIETVKTIHQIEMVKSSLKPGFLALFKDSNGNNLIKTCLTSLGPTHNKFVLETATKYCAEVATHHCGCRVLQCCVSNSFGAERERLVDEICRNALNLSKDPYGNYVVQYLIKQNVPAEKLLMQFRMHYAELATHKFSSHVVEKCLELYPESRAEIVRELLPNFQHLLHDRFANYVIQTALSVTKGPVRAQLVERVSRYRKLSSSPFCKKIFPKTILKK